MDTSNPSHCTLVYCEDLLSINLLFLKLHRMKQKYVIGCIM